MLTESNVNTVYLIISGVTLIAAILSPVLSTWLNNRHQLNMRKLELDTTAKNDEQNHNREIIEGYFMSTGKCVNNTSFENLGLYGSYYALAFQHLPDELHNQMRAINADIISNNYKSASIKYDELALMLRNHTAQSKSN